MPTPSLFELTSILFLLCALFGFANRAFLRLPNSVGLLLFGLLASLLLVAVELLFPDVQIYADIEDTLRQIDFGKVVFDGMLAFLLFAGALHVDFAAMRKRAWGIGYLAVVGTIVATLVTGLLFWLICQAFGVTISLGWSLVFGALISPTDPVGVLTLLKGVKLSEELKAEAEGEALFNDGVGVVLFSLLVVYAAGGEDLTWSGLLWDFVREAIGGAALGLGFGYLAYRAMQEIDDFAIEVLITLALVTTVYALAGRLGMSGPIATVAAGLLIGYRAPKDAMSERTQTYVSALWTLIDEILNAVLFLLIGLEILVLDRPGGYLWVALAAIPIVLLARFVAVSLPILMPLRRRGVPRAHIPFLTWAAIRGGISIALALALPPSPAREVILVATYAVVLFSILGQGLSLASVARRLGLASEGD